MALRSLLSRYKSISRPSVFSGGSSYSSLAKRQISAEDAIIDDQYEQGNLSAEVYLSKLTDRLSRSWITPLQAQTLSEKIRNVEVDVVDASYDNAYQKGQITSRDMYDYEKAKLDKMTEPGSQAYIKQEQKIQGLLDKSEREDRSDVRRQTMLQISQMPEDSSEKIWQKAQLYDQLEQQARADGDFDTADTLATQKNNYLNSAKRADINDLITGTKLQVSETFGAGFGTPSAEGGASLYSELTGGSAPGIASPAVKNALEGLDRQKMSLDRLYQNRADKENMINTYKQAIDQASGDQKTQLTIAFNNLQSDIASIDNQIANTTQNITDTVYGIQEKVSAAAASSFSQEVRKNNSMFDKFETDLETEFKKGKIDKVEYMLRAVGVAGVFGKEKADELLQKGEITLEQYNGLSGTRAMFYEQVSGGFAQFGNEASADTYMEKTNKAMEIHESLTNIAQNLDDYEPIFVDKDSNLTNLFGDKVRKGDVILSDVRQMKDSGRFNENYANVDGVFHRIHYDQLPPEYLDNDGFLIAGLSSDKTVSKFLDNAYVYTVKDGKVETEKVRFMQDENGVNAITETRANRLINDGAVIQTQTGDLVWKPQMKENPLMKVAAGVQNFMETTPVLKNITSAVGKNNQLWSQGIKDLPANFNLIGQTITSPFKKVADFYSPIIQKGVEGAKDIFEKGKDYASTAINKTQDFFRKMNIFNPREAKAEAKLDEVNNPYDREIVNAFGEDAINAQKVLRYVDESGQVKGENTGFKTGTEVDIPNRDGSIDRGLFRINSNTFNDFMKRKGNVLAQYGIRSWDDMLNPQKNAFMAKLIKDEQGWAAWYAAPPELRSGKEPQYYVSQQPRDLRTRNIELALGLPEGTYKPGYKPSQEAIDKAYRSKDNAMIQLMKDEGFNPSPEPTMTPTSMSQYSSQQQSSGGGGSSWNPPRIDIPQIAQNIGQNIGQAAQKATTGIKNYFTPEYNSGKNFWSTPVAQGMANVQTAVQNFTKPVVQKAKQTVSGVKSWFSNLFKR